MAYNDVFTLFPVDDMTLACTEWFSVQRFFYFVDIGYVPAGEMVPSPLTPSPPWGR